MANIPHSRIAVSGPIQHRRSQRLTVILWGCSDLFDPFNTIPSRLLPLYRYTRQNNFKPVQAPDLYDLNTDPGRERTRRASLLLTKQPD
jgi:hypothetical protein